jgi:hypothetical protein
MKAEHRKELQTNVLAEQLARAYESLKQGPSRTTLYWIGGAVAVVAVVLLFRWFMSSSAEVASDRWKTLDEVVFAEQLDNVLEKGTLKDTPQGRLARYKEARLNLSQGLRELGFSRDLGRKHVEEATKAYEDLARKRERVDLLYQEALWGAAKGHEALGDLAEARKYYAQLSKEFPTSALGKDAAAAIDRLADTKNQADLEELKKAFGAPAGKSE